MPRKKETKISEKNEKINKEDEKIMPEEKEQKITLSLNNTEPVKVEKIDKIDEKKIQLPPELIPLLIQKNDPKEKLKNAILAIILISFFASFLISFIDFKVGNVAIIKIKGVISYDNEDLNLEKMFDFLENVKNNAKIKAIILDINSPGGSAVASHHLMKKILQIKQEKNITVYAVIREYGTSGAYWVATAADKIYADELSLVGSIGVLSSFITLEKFLKQHNITYERIVGGKYKDLGSMFKDLNEEERKLLLEKVFSVHAFFRDSVAKQRNLSEEKINQLATGEFFIAKDAKELGLVDELGTMDDAIKDLEKNKSIVVKPIYYEPEKSLIKSLLGLSNKIGINFGKGIAQGMKEELSNSARIEMIN
ncbi:MAG: signal peptide peptidase SppA [Candidatus Woesearchaeota archaeon]